MQYGTPMPWLVFTNLYVAFCGAALTAATYLLLGQRARLDAIVALVFFATLFIYNLDRLTEPTPGDSRHERWVKQHRRFLWGLTLGAATACITVTFILPKPVILSLLVPGVIALGYCLPVWRSGGQWRRLKQVPGMKLLLIAGVWTYATALLPALVSQALGEPNDLPLWLLLSSRLLFILAVALPFDIPDMQRDHANGITTLPMAVGIDTARHFAIALTLGHLLLAALHPWPLAAGLLVNGLVMCAVLSAMSPKRSVLYYAVLLDGLLLSQSALIYLAQR